MNIVSVMEEWARWMTQRDFHGWPVKTILGRCLDDMPSTLCPICRGKRKMDGYICEVCRGKGKIPMTASTTKINPALIAGTEKHARLPKIQFNYVAHKVDLVIQTGLTERQQEVVGLEYLEPGSQHKKAKILGIAQPVYFRHLGRVHSKVLKALNAS